MWLFNCKPSLRALRTFLNILVEFKRLNLCEEVFLKLMNLRLVPKDFIFNILIKFHCKDGNFEKGFEILEEINRDVGSQSY